MPCAHTHTHTHTHVEAVLCEHMCSLDERHADLQAVGQDARLEPAAKQSHQAVLLDNRLGDLSVRDGHL